MTPYIAAGLESKVLTIEKIINDVCGYLHILPEEIKGTSRKGKVAEARQLISYFACTLLDEDQTFISNKMCYGNRSIIPYNVKKVNGFISIDKNYANKVEILKEIICKL